VTGQLEGQDIGVVFLGRTSDDMVGHVRDALRETGGRLRTVVTVREPVDVGGLADAAKGTRYERLEEDGDLLEPLGRRIGVQLVEGGRLLGAVARPLFSTRAGQLHPLDAVVVVRDPLSLDGEAADRRDALENGVVAGLREAGARAAGAETRDTDPSQVSWYQDHDLSTVDNVDDTAGQAALVFVLAGRRATTASRTPPTRCCPTSSAAPRRRERQLRRRSSAQPLMQYRCTPAPGPSSKT
jgi:hypothetical protein